MPVYGFECNICSTYKEVVHPIRDFDNLPIPECHGMKMEQIYFPSWIVFGVTVGKESGFYTIDYGKRATEDLTPPGKYRRLFKEGTIDNPFWKDDIAKGRMKI